MEKKEKNFEEFTNLYELSKTLRFELKPIGETQEMLEENKVFEKDEMIQGGRSTFIYKLLRSQAMSKFDTFFAGTSL